MRGERKSLVLAREVLGLSEEGCYEFIRGLIEGSSFVRDLVRDVVVAYGESCYGVSDLRKGRSSFLRGFDLSDYDGNVFRRLLEDGVGNDLVSDAYRLRDLVHGVMVALHFFPRYVSYMNVVRYLSGRRRDLGGVYILDNSGIRK